MSVDRQRPDARYRYPGPESFDDDPVDHTIFFGRDREIAEVADRVVADRLTILYAKSGLGKTSLVRAGLFPRLRQLGFAPVSVRPSQLGDAATGAIAAAFGSSCDTHGYVITQSEVHATLADYCRDLLISAGDVFLTPVLVFDQFEEIFRLPRCEQQALVRQLAMLLSRAPPARPDAGAPARSRSRASPNVRVLFSLREEYVGALDEFAPALPGLLANRYRLRPLGREAARKAIEMPAGRPGETFVSPPFEFEGGMVDKILDYVDTRGELEPIHLQIICQHIEREVVRRQAGGEQFSPVSELAYFAPGNNGLRDVLGKFYLDTVNSFPDWRTRRRIRFCCEEALVTTDGRRESVRGVSDVYGLDEPTLDALVDRRLLRREDRLNDIWYELSHDRLAEAVKANRRLRIPKHVWAGVAVAVSIIGALATALWVYVDKEQKIAALNSQLAVLNQRLVRVGQGTTADLIKQGGLKVPVMVALPAGRFNMGSPATESGRDGDEGPLHEVSVGDFELGKYEVTFAEYDQFASAEGRALPDDRGWGRGDRPVINVSWNDAQAYVSWLSKNTGDTYRLPSEAEWEYAARAGSQTPYWWGDDIRRGAEVMANCNGCGSEWDYQRTAPVGQFRENPFGLHDLHGNVWEWTQDCWHDSYRNAPADGTAWEAQDGGRCSARVLRGGSWGNVPRGVRSAYRLRSAPDGANNDVGFRVARTL